jgi:hypothetical protein
MADFRLPTQHELKTGMPKCGVGKRNDRPGQGTGLADARAHYVCLGGHC